MARIVKNRMRRKLRALQEALANVPIEESLGPVSIKRMNKIRASSGSMPISSAGSPSRTRRPRSKELQINDSFLAFVMTTPTGDYRFPMFKDRGGETVYTSYNLTQRFANMHEEMLDIWKRVAVDQAINFDDNLDKSSLRLVRFKVIIEDVTKELFDEPNAYEQQKKLAVIGGISDNDARVLGLAKDRAIYKISANPESHPNDRKLVRRLGELGEEIETNNSILDVLHR